MTHARTPPPQFLTVALKANRLSQAEKGYYEEAYEALSPGPRRWDANPDRTPLDLPTLVDGKPVWLGDRLWRW